MRRACLQHAGDLTGALQTPSFFDMQTARDPTNEPADNAMHASYVARHFAARAALAGLLRLLCALFATLSSASALASLSIWSALALARSALRRSPSACVRAARCDVAPAVT